MTSRRPSVAALLAVAALGLTACGGPDEDTTSSSTTQSSTSATSTGSTDTESPQTKPTDEDSDTPDDGAEDSADSSGPAELTDPGTELALGEAATIPQGEDGATVTVTVTEVTKGASKDLAKLKDASKYKGYTPVYVQYEMAGTDSSSELGGDLLDDVDPILTDGRKASTLVIIGTSPFAKCDRNSIPKDFGPGDTETTCQVAMVSDGQDVAGAQYAPYEGDYSGDGAVIWRR